MAENTGNIDHITSEEDLDQIIPAMHVTVPQTTTDQENDLVSDQVLLGIYGEILDTIRKDRNEVSDILDNFCEMVMNEGDSSSASKEAIVNLVRAKLDSSDKMAKIADLMTRVKLRDRDTFPRYLTAKQENTINIGDAGAKKELLKRLNQAQKKIKKKDDND
jgi:hypothetical protein